MRNLKRVLSLALATVMLLGMMVIGAGAADEKKTAITDLDKVTNKEAVNLMVDLKIIVGKPDGTFDPTGIVDRATMAKLITYIMMGDVDQSSFKGATTDLTDINGNWAEGYIKFCYSNKIISGDGQGHFNPSEPVTTAAAAKMLLVALGYDAKDRGYEGASWSLNVMRDAQSTKETSAITRALTKGASVKANDPLSRDNAAQMIFNALFVQTVKAVPQWDSGKQYIQSYNPALSLAATTYGGLTRATATLVTTTTGKISSVTMTAGLDLNNDATLDTPTGLTKLTASSIDIGKTLVFYVDAANKLISSAAIVPAGTSTGILVPQGLTGNPVTKAGSALKFLKDNNIDETTVVSALTINEFDATGAVSTKSAPFATANAADTIATAIQSIVKGDLVTLLNTDSDNAIEIVTVIHKSVYKLTSDPVLKNDKATGTDKVTIGSIVPNVDVKNVKGYADLKKDDVVLYYKDGDGNYYLEKAEIITGTATGSKGAKVLFEGSYYAQSALGTVATAGTSVSAYLAAGKFNLAAKAYLDNCGNIIAIDNDVESTSNYGVVIKTAWVVDQGVDAGGNKLEAKLVKADGTIENIVISSIDGKSVRKSGTPRPGSGNWADGDNVVNGVTYFGVTDTSGAASADKIVYKYLTKDGKTKLTTGTDSIAAASGVITKGNPVFTTTPPATATTTNATTYLYHTLSGTKDVFTVHTGYANAPTTTNTNISWANDLNARAALVYVDATGGTATSGATTANNYAYVLSTAVATRYVGDDVFYDLTAVLNGDTTTTTLTTESSSIAGFITSPTTAVKGLFKVTLDKNNYVIAATAVTVAANNGWVSVAATDSANGVPAAGVLVVDGTNAGTYTYDGTEKVYLVNVTDGTLIEGTMANIADNDKVTIQVVNNAVGASTAEQFAIKTVYVVTP